MCRVILKTNIYFSWPWSAKVIFRAFYLSIDCKHFQFHFVCFGLTGLGFGLIPTLAARCLSSVHKLQAATPLFWRYCKSASGYRNRNSDKMWYFTCNFYLMSLENGVLHLFPAVFHKSEVFWPNAVVGTLDSHSDSTIEDDSPKYRLMLEDPTTK